MQFTINLGWLPAGIITILIYAYIQHGKVEVIMLAMALTAFIVLLMVTDLIVILKRRSGEH